FSGSKPPITAPPIVERPAAFASADVASAIVTPSTARRTLPYLTMSCSTCLASVIARAALDRAVDADHVAVDVEQRTTRVARVDRGVGLDVVGDRVLVVEQPACVAPFGADDARGDGEVELERIADREHPRADARRGVVTEVERRQVLRVDLDHGDVG